MFAPRQKTIPRPCHSERMRRIRSPANKKHLTPQGMKCCNSTVPPKLRQTPSLCNPITQVTRHTLITAALKRRYVAPLLVWICLQPTANPLWQTVYGVRFLCQRIGLFALSLSPARKKVKVFHKKVENRSLTLPKKHDILIVTY